MIVFIVDISRVLSLEPKGDAPLLGKYFAPDQLLVRFQSWLANQRADQILAQHGLVRTRRLNALSVHVLKLPPGLSVEHAVQLSQVRQICYLQSVGFRRAVADRAAQVRVCRVDDRYRMAFGEHQTIRAGMPRIRRVVAHLTIHQDRDDVGEGEGAGRMSRTGLGGHFDRHATQIDRFGNLNTTVIGEYSNPKVRLPGSGGACEIAINAQRVFVVMRLRRRAFVERVDFVTSPGHLDGPGRREELGIPGLGPQLVVTDKCVFGFDEESKEMVLERVHPGVSIEEMRAEVGWELRLSEDLGETDAPSEEELALVRKLEVGG